jgi:signal transduction histidine kinase
MRREFKLVNLVLVLVVGPAVLLFYMTVRILGDWQVVLQRRMETEAARLMARAEARWLRHVSGLGVATVPGGVLSSGTDDWLKAARQAVQLKAANPWIANVFAWRAGEGLVYPPARGKAGPVEAPVTFLPVLEWPVAGTNLEEAIHAAKLFLDRPGLDAPVRCGVTLNLARLVARAGDPEAAAALYRAAAAIPIREPEEGFWVDLVALREMVGLHRARGDGVAAAAGETEMVKRVLDRFDGLAPSQRALLVEALAPGMAVIEGGRHGALWRERLRAREDTGDAPAVMVQDMERVSASVAPGTWNLTSAGGRWFLVGGGRGLEGLKPGRVRDGAATAGAVLWVECRLPGMREAVQRLAAAEAEGTGARLECRLRDGKARDGARGEGPVFGERLFAAPFDRFELAAYPSDPRAFLANARLQKRLMGWGGGVLFVCIVAGGGIVWREAAREIRQARERSAFAAAVSHDLRTPLSSMRMLAESLQMGSVQDEAKRRKFLDVIVRESDRLSRLTDRALYYIRYGQGDLHYTLTEGDVGMLIREVAGTFAVGAGGQVETGGRLESGPPPVGDPVRVRLAIAPGLPAVRFDPGAMEQVLYNLMDNALKYSAGCRTMDVTAGMRPGERHGAGGEVVISVRDYGVGLTPDDLGRALKPYRRGRAAALNARGIGLGLAVCRHIVKAHHGRLEVESRPGQGSTFRVVLPVASPAA